MRLKKILFALLTVVFSLGASTMSSGKSLQVMPASHTNVSLDEKSAIAEFNKRVRDYVKLRNRAKAKAPKLSKDSTPEQIAAFEKTFVEALRTARAGAKPGDLFTPDVAQFLRDTLKGDFKPAEKKEIRKVVLEAEAARAPLRVNYPYPDSSEFTEMPAKVLLKLPQLPKELKYRYVGRNLFLVDADNNLIIDFMLDALP
jgi:hypothetical protein